MVSVALLASRRRRRQAAFSLTHPSVPSVALQKVGGAWVVDTANAVTPDGYFVSTGGKLVIDTAASSGLAIAVAGGKLLIGT